MMPAMPSPPPPNPTSAVTRRVFESLQDRALLGTVRTLLQRFREDRLALTASSLTFTSVISVVPLATVMLALFTAFPMFADLLETLQRYFVATLVPDTIAKPLLGYVGQFSSRASRLGVFGLVALVVSAIALMLTIDRALNAIWRVRTPRPIAQRILIYWGAVTLGPLALGVSLAATSYAVSVSRGYFGSMPRSVGIGLGGLEFTTMALGFAALFHYVPNTHVRWRHALIGGVFVAVGFAAVKRLLALYFGTVPTYALVYGVFATLPIFLIWIYVSWIIVLLGAVLAAYAPVAGTQIVRWAEVPGFGFHLAIQVLRALREAKVAGRSGLSDSQLSQALGVDPLQIAPLLDTLVRIDWIGKLDEAGNPRYVMLVDDEALAEPLLAALLIEPRPWLASFWKQAGFDRLQVKTVLTEPLPA